MISSAKHAAVTGDALVKTGPGLFFGVLLTGGSDAATIVLYDNTSATGTILATVKAAINTTAVWTPAVPYAFGTGIYADVTGTAMAAYVVYV